MFVKRSTAGFMVVFSPCLWYDTCRLSGSNQTMMGL